LWTPYLMGRREAANSIRTRGAVGRIDRRNTLAARHSRDLEGVGLAAGLRSRLREMNVTVNSDRLVGRRAGGGGG